LRHCCEIDFLVLYDIIVLGLQFPREIQNGSMVMLYVILGIIVGLVLRVVFLRVTTWVVEQEYKFAGTYDQRLKESFWKLMVFAICSIRVGIWFTWFTLAANTHHPFFFAITITGLVTYCIWVIKEDIRNGGNVKYPFLS